VLRYRGGGKTGPSRREGSEEASMEMAFANRTNVYTRFGTFMATVFKLRAGDLHGGFHTLLTKFDDYLKYLKVE
jgi:hypothetical protein